MAPRPRRTERFKALHLACWNADGMCGRKLELEHFLSQHGVNICLLIRHSLTWVKPSGLLLMSATAQTDRQLARHSYLGPPWYSPPISVRSVPGPLGGYCHPSYIGPQTSVNPGGLPFAFPPTDRSRSDRLFRREIAKHVDWNSWLSTRRGNSYMIMPTKTPV